MSGLEVKKELTLISLLVAVLLSLALFVGCDELSSQPATSVSNSDEGINQPQENSDSDTSPDSQTNSDSTADSTRESSLDILLDYESRNMTSYEDWMEELSLMTSYIEDNSDMSPVGTHLVYENKYGKQVRFVRLGYDFGADTEIWDEYTEVQELLAGHISICQQIYGYGWFDYERRDFFVPEFRVRYKEQYEKMRTHYLGDSFSQVDGFITHWGTIDILDYEEMLGLDLMPAEYSMLRVKGPGQIVYFWDLRECDLTIANPLDDFEHYGEQIDVIRTYLSRNCKPIESAKPEQYPPTELFLVFAESENTNWISPEEIEQLGIPSRFLIYSDVYYLSDNQLVYTVTNDTLVNKRFETRYYVYNRDSDGDFRLEYAFNEMRG